MKSRYLHFLNREIDEKIMSDLANLITHLDLNDISIVHKEYFKNFIDSSFRAHRLKRPSVSQLSDIFKKYGSKIPGDLACAYAIALEEKADLNELVNFYV